jgi:hypothetical protein
MFARQVIQIQQEYKDMLNADYKQIEFSKLCLAAESLDNEISLRISSEIQSKSKGAYDSRILPVILGGKGNKDN